MSNIQQPSNPHVLNIRCINVNFIVLYRKIFNTIGEEPWSSGKGRQLTIKWSWVPTPAPEN